MNEVSWFERELIFGKPIEMLRYYLECFISVRTAKIQKYQTVSQNVLKKSSLHPRLKVQLIPVDLAWFDAEHHLVKNQNLIVQQRSHARV